MRGGGDGEAKRLSRGRRGMGAFCRQSIACVWVGVGQLVLVFVLAGWLAGWQNKTIGSAVVGRQLAIYPSIRSQRARSPPVFVARPKPHKATHAFEQRCRRRRPGATVSAARWEPCTRSTSKAVSAHPLAVAVPPTARRRRPPDAHQTPDRKSTRLNSSHSGESRMPSSA